MPRKNANKLLISINFNKIIILCLNCMFFVPVILEGTHKSQK